MMSSLISEKANSLKPSASIAAKQMVSDLLASGHQVIDFTIGEPDIATPAHIVEAALAAASSGNTHYTASAGAPALRKAIAGSLNATKKLPYSAENIAVGCGAKQLIFETFSATLNAGDEVIIPTPYWVSYPDIARLHGGEPVIVPCDADTDFKLTPEKLEAAIGPRTKWVVLNSPNNPSGAVYSAQELRALGDVLVRHPHVWVMTDEIYEHLYYEGDRSPSFLEAMPAAIDRTVVINGMSKAYAMTGWRIGYAAGPKTLIDVVVKLLSQSTTCASSVSQAAAVAALSGSQDCVREATEMYRARRDRMVELLRDAPGLGIRVPPGAFYLYVSVADLIGRRTQNGKVLETDLDVSLYFLEEAKVAVLDGAAYGLSPYLRLSFATSMDAIENGSRAIASACRKLLEAAPRAAAQS